MTTYWAEHAWLPTGLATGVRFDVVDGVFAKVHRRARPDAGDERLHGVVLPGFANAHSHAFHRALRGRTHGDGGNFWTWRQQMYAVTRHLDPDTYLALARAVFAEMVLAGITVVGEFHYVHHDVDGKPYADPNAMGEAVIQAAREAGLRLTLLDTCYLAGGLAGDGHLPVDEVQRRFTDGDVDAWATRVAALAPDATTRIGAAVHSVRAVPRDDLRAMAEVTRGRPVHAHVSEQPAENLATQMFYGATPTELLDEAGLLGERFSAVHATHLSDHDVALLGRLGEHRVLLPHDRARPRRRHRPGPRPHGRGRSALARLRPACGHRPLRGGARPGDARTPHQQRTRPVHPGRAADRRHGRGSPQPRVAGRRPDRRRCRSGLRRRPHGHRQHRRGRRRARSSTARRGPTSTRSSWAAARSWSRVVTTWATSPRCSARRSPT